ncbi:cyclase family protein [Nakamurella flavida]|uniref:Cyclase family protein n=1 Tax=Nakamurella flavida TaxID=363630 RepID=A0A938YG69_9ACTN|nr:cyclase family protein [Nakamurella flavida]MBM9477096.1 cyclase family protein [Nakamurella flavida]MDP9780042.1 kynurenine formamidase [Nakamurella flavida]
MTGRRVVDLAHPVVEGMITYPGIPGPALGSHLSFADSRAIYAPGTEFSIGTIAMAANTGTYLDTPAHRYDGGDDLSVVPLARMVDLDGLVVRAHGVPSVGPEVLDGLDVRGRAVLVDTGHSRHWGTEAYAVDHPSLSTALAERLVALGATLVGIDSLNIDATRGGERPVHSALLAAGIPVVEHLRGLGDLPDAGFRFSAAPPAVVGMATFTVRAFAVVG